MSFQEGSFPIETHKIEGSSGWGGSLLQGAPRFRLNLEAQSRQPIEMEPAKLNLFHQVAISIQPDLSRMR